MADSEKTEEPTGKRLGEARRKGNIMRSQDAVTAAMLLASLFLLRWTWEPASTHLTALMRKHLGKFPDGDLSPESLSRVALEDAFTVLGSVGPMLGGLLIVGIVTNYLMVGPLLTTEVLRPDLSKLNPLSGLKRLFAMRALVDLIKGTAKILIVAVVVWQVLADRFGAILMGLRSRPEQVGPLIADAAWTLAIECVLVLVAIAILDYFWQRYDYRKSLRMTKQEVKDEAKQQEGDPLVKGEQKKRMRQAARRRMLAQVPQATVVVTNPTHYAVALQYDAHRNINVPIVVAKGVDDVAWRIRSLASEHGVPMVQQPSLARELFRSVDLGEAIPAALYAAVAEILVVLNRNDPQRVAL